jgi:hypothetical protein
MMMMMIAATVSNRMARRIQIRMTLVVADMVRAVTRSNGDGSRVRMMAAVAMMIRRSRSTVTVLMMACELECLMIDLDSGLGRRR